MRREEHGDRARDRDKDSGGDGDKDGAPAQPPGRFGDDLVGLDPDDPEAQAFAAHLDRVESVPKPYTVEGYLTQFGDFAEAANRREGHRRLSAVVISWTVILALASAAVVALITLVDVLGLL
ncbi:hypothetical protein GCM10022247_56880 [Allokutzneria multivorans]|uniref:Uncharacterized protein n=1 Tax=Allokutzneria multivorans TaxID=1142134 RepID=A0ABP7TEC1_9PSEU